MKHIFALLFVLLLLSTVEAKAVTLYGSKSKAIHNKKGYVVEEPDQTTLADIPDSEETVEADDEIEVEDEVEEEAETDPQEEKVHEDEQDGLDNGSVDDDVVNEQNAVVETDAGETITENKQEPVHKREEQETDKSEQEGLLENIFTEDEEMSVEDRESEDNANEDSKGDQETSEPIEYEQLEDPTVVSVEYEDTEEADAGIEQKEMPEITSMPSQEGNQIVLEEVAVTTLEED